MNFLILVLQVLALFTAATLAAPTAKGESNDTLVLVHVLFRHGNRAVDQGSIYPNDPYINETYAPVGLSQLTQKGKRTEYNIGSYLRSTYNNFIPRQYTPDLVYAISTNFKRTKMSLELVLTALFPPLLNATLLPTIDWQPIPFNIEPGQGIIGTATSYCANYINSYFTYILSAEAQAICDSYRELYDVVSQFTGKRIRTPRDLSGVYFSLKSEEDFGLQLPAWTEGLYPEVIEEAVSVDYEFNTATPTLRKLSAGFLLQKIIQDSLAKQSGSLSAERKIFLYSAHEYNVATMLRTLNVFFRHVPPFGATIIFEIHNVNGAYGLKLLYLDYKQEGPKVLTIPGCSTICPLSTLQELIGGSLPGPNDVCSSTTEVL